MAVEYGKCIFRVIGCLSPGYLELEYVGRGEGPVVIRQEDVGMEIRRWDEVWIREIPIEAIPPDCRMPNCLLEITARGRTEVISVLPVSSLPR